MRSFYRGCLAFFLVLICSSMVYSAPVKIIPLKTSINPVVQDFLSKKFNEFKTDGTKVVILQLDTPGGLLEATRLMIQDFLSAPFIVVTHVAPQGARAASAGFFLLMASDIAVMDQMTNTGSASPVSMGMGNEKKEKDPVMERKIMEDLYAMMRNLAKMHNRNPKYLIDAVEKAKSYTAKEALDLKIIDLIAPDTSDIIKYLESREKYKKNNQEILLKNLSAETIQIPWHKSILLFLANPNLVYIFMMIGIYAIIFEVMTPGGGIAGFIGFICLVLALMGMSIISINAAGIIFIVLGIILLILETVFISHGLLAAGGIAVLGFGSFMFFESYPESFSFVRGVLVGLSIVMGGFLFLVISKVSKLRKKETPFFKELQKSGRATEDFVNQRGMVFIEGENWQAFSEENLKKEDEILVVGQQGMVLTVKKK